MKKTVWFAFCCALLIVFAMVFDYLYNERFHRVEFHTVSLTEIQNKMEFTAPVEYEDGLYLMKGAVKQIDNITAGATALINWDGNTMEGYLYRLEPAFEDVSYATVSVIAPKMMEGDATAVIYGTCLSRQILVPKECIVTDSHGKDAVFLELNGYAVMRNVEVGKRYPDGQVQVLSGIFQDEKLILTPRNLRVGDRVFGKN